MNIMRSVHRLLSPLIYRDGTAIVPAQVAPEWAERQFLRRLLHRLRVDCVIDVGANVGQYANILRLIGFQGTILSFEPSPQIFAKLASASAHDDRWHVFDSALGAEAGTIEFNIMEASEFSSVRQPTRRDTAQFESDNQVVERIHVAIERLDQVLPRLRDAYGFQRPFLKTDTQGFDIEVLRGAAGVHRELAGIECELAIKHLYEDVKPWTEAIEEYVAAGFELAGIFDVHPRKSFFIECNCFFVRPQDAGTPVHCT